MSGSKLFDYFWQFAGAVNVRTKILGIVLGLVLLLGSVTTLQIRAMTKSALLKRLEEQSVATARDVAARATDLILINDMYALHQLLEETQLNNPDVRYAFILDANGEVLAHTFGEGFPIDLLSVNNVDGEAHHMTVKLESEEGAIWDSAVPIFDGQAGVARVGLSEESVNATVETIIGQMLLSMVVVSAVGIGAAVFLTWVVTRPILELQEAAQAVGRGEFSRRVTPWAGDEIGALAKAFNHMAADLERADKERVEREKLRLQLLEKVISAQEDERRRISRELHDETGQSLTSLMVRMQMMMQQCAVPQLTAQIEDLKNLVGDTLENVHNLARELRPSILDDMGLDAAVQRYVSDCSRRYNLAADVVTLGFENERLPAAVETALYRIVQEGLTNIARHSSAKSASIMLERRNGRVRAIIEDDGKGFDYETAVASGRLGLYGMKERAELLGGTFAIESNPNQGTSIFVEVPV
ncbi:MAG: HAMP domain-containing protein [Candidatus Promineifilaceae bacterium]